MPIRFRKQSLNRRKYKKQSTKKAVSIKPSLKKPIKKVVKRSSFIVQPKDIIIKDVYNVRNKFINNQAEMIQKEDLYDYSEDDFNKNLDNYLSRHGYNPKWRHDQDELTDIYNDIIEKASKLVKNRRGLRGEAEKKIIDDIGEFAKQDQGWFKYNALKKDILKFALDNRITRKYTETLQQYMDRLIKLYKDNEDDDEDEEEPKALTKKSTIRKSARIGKKKTSKKSIGKKKEPEEEEEEEEDLPNLDDIPEIKNEADVIKVADKFADSILAEEVKAVDNSLNNSVRVSKDIKAMFKKLGENKKTRTYWTHKKTGLREKLMQYAELNDIKPYKDEKPKDYMIRLEDIYDNPDKLDDLPPVDQPDESMYYDPDDLPPPPGTSSRPSTPKNIPPPPPMPGNIPPPPPMPPMPSKRGDEITNLLADLKKGSPLKKVEVQPRPKDDDAMLKVFDAIKQGKNLKKAEVNEKPTSYEPKLAVLADIQKGVQLKDSKQRVMNEKPQTKEKEPQNQFETSILDAVNKRRHAFDDDEEEDDGVDWGDGRRRKAQYKGKRLSSHEKKFVTGLSHGINRLLGKGRRTRKMRGGANGDDIGSTVGSIADMASPIVDAVAPELSPIMPLIGPVVGAIASLFPTTHMSYASSTFTPEEMAYAKTPQGQAALQQQYEEGMARMQGHGRNRKAKINLKKNKIKYF